MVEGTLSSLKLVQFTFSAMGQNAEQDVFLSTFMLLFRHFSLRKRVLVTPIDFWVHPILYFVI